MNVARLRSSTRLAAFWPGLAVTLVLSGVVGATGALADDDDAGFKSGNLLVSRSVYDNNPASVVAGTTLLPPNCVAPNCVTATDSGAYPFVFNNVLTDGSFGITSKIVLDQLRPTGQFINSLEVEAPDSHEHRDHPAGNQVVTSFPSKSEIALNLSTDGRVVTFMAYVAPINALDVSNSNTPAVVDPSNPVPGSFSRLVAEVDARGRFRFTKTNAYSGNNGRAAILNEKNGVLYTVGNAGNGGNPQPNGIIIGAGAQIMTPAQTPLAAQNPGLPTPVGSFNTTQLGLTADKTGKDTNFRGLTVSNNVIYTTKGSGGNGINTVYFIDTTGFDANGKPLACPSGVGLPSATAALPTAPIFYDATKLQTLGVVPYNMCILKGLPTTLAKAKTEMAFPFGVWFADAKTLYVTDEGNGTNTFDPVSGKYTVAAAQTGAGLQKWVFDSGLGAWKLAYVLQAGLNLGVPYTVANYPTGINPRTSLPWAPAADGLRNLTGRVNRDGTATIWAITSTVSGNGDQGADPNALVMITDNLAATSLPAGESFAAVRAARFGEVLRGVSFTPGTDRDHLADADDDHRDHDRDDRRDDR